MKFLKDSMQEHSLVELLTYSLESREHNVRFFHSLHASTLTNQDKPFCPREAYIARKNNFPEKSMHIGAAMRVAFDVGEAVHSLVPEKWLGDHAVGNWTCKYCHGRHDYVRKPAKCNHCLDGTLFWYEELVFRDDKRELVGSIDLLYQPPGEEECIAVEIKTMDKDQFAELNAPLGEHRLRTILYLHMIRSSPKVNVKVNTDRAKILYVSKGYGKKSVIGKILPFKEFDVAYNHATIEPYLTLAEQSLVSAETIPGRICATSFVPRVKKCCCPKQCWSGEYE